MIYLIDNQWIIKNYCQHATLKLCCAKEEESGRGIAVRGGLGSVFKSFWVNFGVKAAQIDDRKLIRIGEYGSTCEACGRRFQRAFTFKIDSKTFENVPRMKIALLLGRCLDLIFY
jgi:hypothetical protein